MNDLMKRLRSEAVNWSASCGDLFDEAADRIEALEAALREIDAMAPVTYDMTLTMGDIARAALTPKRDK